MIKKKQEQPSNLNKNHLHLDIQQKNSLNYRLVPEGEGNSLYV